MMSKSEEFLQQLKSALAHLPYSEVERVVSYYSENLQDKIEDGVSEEDAIASFGNLDEFVSMIEEEVTITSIVKDKVMKKSKDSNVNKMLIGIIAVLGIPIWIGLGGLAIGLGIGFLAVFWSIPFVLGSMYISLAFMSVSGILIGFIRMFTFEFATGLAYFGFGVTASGLVVMFFQPIVQFFRVFGQWNLWPFKKIKQKLLKRK